MIVIFLSQLSSVTDISELTLFSVDSVMVSGFFLPPREKHSIISFKLEIHIEKILQHMCHFPSPQKEIDSVLICTGFMEKAITLINQTANIPPSLCDPPLSDT